jgi:glycosyltransferase involved in cell wall biosynthesis
VKLGLVVPGGVSSLPEEGTIPCLHWLIERLARRHDVHVFSIFGASRPEYRFLGATIHHSGARPIRFRIHTLSSIAAEHSKGAFDVLHAFWVHPPGVIAAALGVLLRRPVVLHVAGTELVAMPDIRYGNLVTARGRLWVRLGLSGATRITAASASMLDAIRARGYAAEQVPLGVGLQEWPPASPRVRTVGSTARLIHVGDLNPVKDQVTLLEAARKLADYGVEFELTIAGRDTLHGRLQRHAQTLGLTNRVRFLGRLPHDRLHALMAESDILWLSSRHEAGPLVVLEAAVAGVPTVGTAVGHVAEWAPQAAVAVPLRDPEALARETLTLLGDEERRLALAREAQRRALACDADWTARRFESLYEELVSAARPKGRGR